MKLTIKTLKQKIFTIDVWGEETVFEVKEKIQAVRGSHLENQKLFHAGQLVLVVMHRYGTNIYVGQELANDRTVASYDIDEDEFLVLVVSKVFTYSTVLDPLIVAFLRSKNVPQRLWSCILHPGPGPRH